MDYDTEIAHLKHKMEDLKRFYEAAITSQQNAYRLSRLNIGDTNPANWGDLNVSGSIVVNGVAVPDGGGWVLDQNTWTYTGLKTMTAPGDVSSLFRAGMPIKLMNVTQKYFYVESTVYAAGVTTLTLMAGSDYTLANAAISGVYYSRFPNPQLFPFWFNYAATVSGSTGSAGTYAETSDAAMFAVVGRMITAIVSKTITNKGSWSGNVRVLRPWQAGTVKAPFGASAGGIYAAGGTAPKAIMDTEDGSLFYFMTYGTATYQWASIVVGDYISINYTYPIPA